MTSNLESSYLSSTIVKEFASYGGDISNFVPPEIIECIYAKYDIIKKGENHMDCRIELVISDIENYIEKCNPQVFNRSIIVVNKDIIEEFLSELKAKASKEIKRYQKIINNKEAILMDSQKKADENINQAEIQIIELLNEHQIMQQAYPQANEIVSIERKQAEEILDCAIKESNDIYIITIIYTDGQFSSMESTLSHSIYSSKARNEDLLFSLNEYLNVGVKNDKELNIEEVGETYQRKCKITQKI